MFDVEGKHSISVLRNDTFIGCENIAKALAKALNILITTKIDKNNLQQNDPQIHLCIYPNPFKEFIKIEYELFKELNVEVKIWDLYGKEIKTFMNGHQTVGCNSVKWDAKNDLGIQVPAGVYLCKIQSGSEVHIKKIIFSNK